MKGENLKITVQTRKCVYCNKSSLIEMTRQEFQKIEMGLPLDVAVPEWSMDKRELVITGTHPECWDKMFSEMDEDDEAV